MSYQPLIVLIMFNDMKLEPIGFVSNPDLGDGYVVELSTNDVGSPINKVVMKPRSNRPFYDGIVYDPSTMSLRAQLNCGVDLQRVSFGATENDPIVLYSAALRFERSINQQYEEIRKKEVPEPAPSGGKAE